MANKIKWNDADAKAMIKANCKKALWNVGNYILSESKKQVPLDTGALQRSGAVDVNEEGNEAAVSYDTPYAVRQHEMVHYFHQRGRKAKYLEDVVNDTTVRDKSYKYLRQYMRF